MTSWRKVRSIALFEFLTVVRSKSYLILTFGMPVILLLYGGLISIPALLEARKGKEVAIYGVVDEAGVLGMTGEVSMPPAEIPAEVRQAMEISGQRELLSRPMTWWQNFVFRPFPSEPPARAALGEGRIRAYFRIPPDYLQTGILEHYSGEGPDRTDSESRKAFPNLIVSQMLRGKIPEALAERIRKPIVETKRFTLTKTGEVKQGGGLSKVVRLVVPVAFTILLLLSVVMTAGGLVQATAIEKENKVVEVILSSADPDEILIGKLLGVGGTGALQMTVWFAMAGVAGLAFTAVLAAIGFEIPWGAMVTAVCFFVAAYFFYGSLMLGTGSLGANQRESNQWGMIWSLPLVVPMLFMESILNEPHGTAGTVMTWIPFTAANTTVLRMCVDPSGVAWWEVAGGSSIHWPRLEETVSVVRAAPA